MKIKQITYVFAGGIAAIAAFAATPAGQALVHQYPVLSSVFAAVAALGVLFHTPTSGGTTK